MQKKMNSMNNVVLLEMLKKQSNPKRGKYQVILYDDNKTTFEHVVDCLIDVCSHNELQAYQCALIVHNSGKCSIFVDSYDECELVCEYLTKLDLKVTIEKFKK
jgi:ATP-dependent Clp protease adaptor protein ClpS